MFTDFFFKRGKPAPPTEEKKGGLFNLDAKLDNMFGMFKKDVMGMSKLPEGSDKFRITTLLSLSNKNKKQIKV